ncbi:unnamed protein product [Boreogadus saida]
MATGPGVSLGTGDAGPETSVNTECLAPGYLNRMNRNRAMKGDVSQTGNTFPLLSVMQAVAQGRFRVFKHHVAAETTLRRRADVTALVFSIVTRRDEREKL